MSQAVPAIVAAETWEHVFVKESAVMISSILYVVDGVNALNVPDIVDVLLLNVGDWDANSVVPALLRSLTVYPDIDALSAVKL